MNPRQFSVALQHAVALLFPAALSRQGAALAVFLKHTVLLSGCIYFSESVAPSGAQASCRRGIAGNRLLLLRSLPPDRGHPGIPNFFALFGHGEFHILLHYLLDLP